MARKKKQTDFTVDRNTLDFRPNISFIEPDQVPESPPPPTVGATLDEIKTDTDNLIDDYKALQTLCDQAQNAISARSADISIKLDPALDAHVLSALQRHTGDPNKTEITFDDYLECLNHINAHSADNFSTAKDQVRNQFETGFGSLGFPSGLARPELQPETQSISPLDMKSFQVQIIEELLKLLNPGITKIAIDQAKKVIGL